MGHYDDCYDNYDKADRQREARRAARLQRMQDILFRVLVAECGDSDKDLKLVEDMADHIAYMLHKEMR